MLKSVKAALLGAMLVGTAVSTQAADLKVAYFNLERILTSSISADIASDRLNQEAQRRQAEVESLTKRYKQRYEQYQASQATMTQTERLEQQRQLAEIERDMARRDSEMRDEINLRRNDEVILLQNRVAQIVKRLADEEHYDLVINDAFYASPRVDITDRVIKELDKGLKPVAK